MQIMEKTLETLIMEIKNTTIYKTYKMQKSIIEQYPALVERIDDFRRRNLEIQNSESQEVMFEAMDRFEKEYEQFREDPLVNDFLEAELAYCRMMQDIHLRITEEVEFE